jgi:hypothetical protein
MLWTNKGKAHFPHATLRRTSLPANYYVALCTSATAPTAAINTLGELTEIAAGSGYTAGGYQLTPGTTDFDTLTEDDVNDHGTVYIKAVAWPASGGSIPASGSGARYAVLTDDNATVADREVYIAWDLGEDKAAIDGNTLTLDDLGIRIA